MKFSLFYSILILIFISIVPTFVTTSCSKKGAQTDLVSSQKGQQTIYTCAMHPQVRTTQPGKCPICHMNLIPLSSPTPEGASASGPKENAPTQHQHQLWRCQDEPTVTSETKDICPLDGKEMIPVQNDSTKQNSQVMAELRLKKSQIHHFKSDTFIVTPMKMVKNVRLLGIVKQIEENQSSIPAKIAGRIEKVYIKSTGSYVQANDKVVDIYSPELITGGEEYLLARSTYETRKASEYLDLLKQSEQKLKLWGIKPFQYEDWYKNKKVPKSITIYSDATGIVQKKIAIVGKYFAEGQNLFELADLGQVWVELDVYEQDSTLVKMDQQVSMEFIALPGENYHGVINFIYPTLDTKSRTLKVRTTIDNINSKLRPGMVANAEIRLEFPGTPLAIPRSAVINTGKRKVVWTELAENTYQAKEISTGNESEGLIEIVKGVQEGEKVVINGNFLLDAQTQLFGGFEQFE